jgi:translation initiation factor 3 subunit H
VSWRDVFVEVPIKVHNSSLAQALIADINPAPGATAADLERLNLGSAAYISKTMTNLIDCLDDLVGEQQKVRGWETEGRGNGGHGMAGGQCVGAGE